MYYKLPRPKEQHIVCTAVRSLRDSALQCPSDTVILECNKRREIKLMLIKLKYLKRQIEKTQIHKSLEHSYRIKAGQRVPKTVRSWSRGDNRTGAPPGHWRQFDGSQNSAKAAGRVRRNKWSFRPKPNIRLSTQRRTSIALSD